MRSIVGMASVKMYLEPFGNEPKFMPESFGQNVGMPPGLGNVHPKRFDSPTDDLPNLLQ
jgi:hypothetical protein